MVYIHIRTNGLPLYHQHIFMKKRTLIQSEQLCRVPTDDGSFTLQRQDSGLLYRSKQGAIQESLSVFVHGTHLPSISNTWRVFELGLGQGRNFFQTYQEAQKHKVYLEYVAVDHLPIPPEFGLHPLVCDVLQKSREQANVVESKDRYASLTLYPFPFLDCAITKTFDAIFHDPFGPAANPDCWIHSCFEKEYSLLKKEGIWSSYGASGQMRRELAQAGFFVARGPGIGRKRETTRASPSEKSLDDYRIKYRPKPKF